MTDRQKKQNVAWLVGSTEDGLRFVLKQIELQNVGGPGAAGKALEEASTDELLQALGNFVGAFGAIQTAAKNVLTELHSRGITPQSIESMPIPPFQEN